MLKDKIEIGINWAFIIGMFTLTFGAIIPYTLKQIKSNSQMKKGLGLK